MRRPITARILWAHPLRLIVASVLLAGAALTAVGDLKAASAEDGPSRRWTRTITLDLTAGELGQPGNASPRTLARAAVRRTSRRLGLARSANLALDRSLRPPAGRGIVTVRLRQTAAGLRLVWSQIDVTIVHGEVRMITATVLPTRSAPAGERRVSAERAVEIARAEVPDSELALRPLPAAYAGTPAEPWRGAPRRVWVVEVQPASAGDEAVAGLCIVIDAATGEVLARWPGMADRPDRGPLARGGSPASAGKAALATATAPTRPLVYVQDARKPGDPSYATFNVTGDPRDAAWPHYNQARLGAADPLLDQASQNARNVARTICDLRGYCGSDGGFRDRTSTYSGTTRPWTVLAAEGLSNAQREVGKVALADVDIMPIDAANDVLAHEMGHVMDWWYAGDRLVPTNDVEGRGVEEAIADMFAYEYDRFDATQGEDSHNGVLRNWANPHTPNAGGVTFPAHMNEYDPSRTPHYNSTILSHAYYLFVQAVGHHKAGRVLHTVPGLLPPLPRFANVSRSFVTLGGYWYPQDGPDPRTASDVAEAAQRAFDQVGLHHDLPRDHRGE